MFVFKNGDAAHTNTFELGQHGRYRTNVWEYAGVNTFRTGRLDELAMHPTVKPVAMLADAIRDVTKRGAIVLDPFAGSGSTLIAAEKTGRQARCIEYEPKYCDVIVRRWQAYTGKACHSTRLASLLRILKQPRASSRRPADGSRTLIQQGAAAMTEKAREPFDPTDMDHPLYNPAEDPTHPFYEGDKSETEHSRIRRRCIQGRSRPSAERA